MPHLDNRNNNHLIIVILLLILQEAEKLYNELTTELIHRVMAAAYVRASSLPPANIRQNDTYQTEEYRYNNQS